VRPSGEDAEEHQDHDNQQNGAKAHDLLLLVLLFLFTISAFFKAPAVVRHSGYVTKNRGAGKTARVWASANPVCTITYRAPFFGVRYLNGAELVVFACR
jgi:hypothetical protein